MNTYKMFLQLRLFYKEHFFKGKGFDFVQPLIESTNAKPV